MKTDCSQVSLHSRNSDAESTRELFKRSRLTKSLSLQ